MATLDRQIPSPDTFLCEPWSSFVSAAKLRFVDCNQFPALEDFSLVVCHVCSKVVTPQGILTHYGKPHTYTNPLSMVLSHKKPETNVCIHGHAHRAV
uniref:Ataxin 7 like 1 n=1 Tax=Neolamprologus brichardi TaxID=32507 RepID=A0A3Q4M4P8_NEOBR